MSRKLTLRLAAKNPDDDIIALKKVVEVLSHGPLPAGNDIVELKAAELPKLSTEAKAGDVRHIPNEQLETVVADAASRILAKIEERIEQGGVTVTVSETEIQLQIHRHKSWLREFMDEGGKMFWVALKEAAMAVLKRD